MYNQISNGRSALTNLVDAHSHFFKICDLIGSLSEVCAYVMCAVRRNYSVCERLQFEQVQFVSLPDAKYNKVLGKRLSNVGFSARSSLKKHHPYRSPLQVYFTFIPRAGLFFNTLEVYEPLPPASVDFNRGLSLYEQ